VTGESLTEAIATAIRDRLRVVERDGRTPAQVKEDVMAIVKRYSEHRVIDDRTPDEIIDYDERGLPR
jgi:antitoxin VapB